MSQTGRAGRLTLPVEPANVSLADKHLPPLACVPSPLPRWKPGASIAAAALERSINANLLRRWVIEAERAEAGSPLPVKAATVMPVESFVALPLPTRPADDTPIKIEVSRAAMTLSVV
jgi:hypothetical protein